ncbi:Squalene/phytoene synthase [Hypoxylon sp. FL1284]|nr:Squalene/phytoene synthase [Hypoxylon sp. FL1284]
MNSVTSRARIAQQGLRWPRAPSQYQRRSITTEEDVVKARQYCVGALDDGDHDSYIIRHLLPQSQRDAYDVTRAFALEISRIPEAVSNTTTGLLRMQFWRDAVNNTFAGKPPREPIMTLLHKVISDLDESEGTRSSVKYFLMRHINTREKRLDNPPFATLAAMEEFAENSYSSIMYATLAALSVRSMHMDHFASHVGKAIGIVANLQNIPFMVAPQAHATRPHKARALCFNSNPALLLPLDIMAETGLKEEDVFRQGARADGFQDAVFKVATRAHDHLITAKEIFNNLNQGKTPGHEYEHSGEEQHEYPSSRPEDDDIKRELRRGFSVALEYVVQMNYLTRLQKADFDPYQVGNNWRLSMELWRTAKNKSL